MKTVHQIIAGALYSFAGALTCREGTLTVGSSHNAGPMAEAVDAFCREHGLLGPNGAFTEPAIKDWRQLTNLLPPVVNDGIEPEYAKRLEHEMIGQPLGVIVDEPCPGVRLETTVDMVNHRYVTRLICNGGLTCSVSGSYPTPPMSKPAVHADMGAPMFGCKCVDCTAKRRAWALGGRPLVEAGVADVATPLDEWRNGNTAREPVTVYPEGSDEDVTQVIGASWRAKD